MAVFSLSESESQLTLVNLYHYANNQSTIIAGPRSLVVSANGAILFVGCAVGDVTIEQVLRRIWPFYGVMFLVLMLVTYIPSISLWLPRMLSL